MCFSRKEEGSLSRRRRFSSPFSTVSQNQDVPQSYPLWVTDAGVSYSTCITGTERVDERTPRGEEQQFPRYMCIVKQTRDKGDCVTSGENSGLPVPTVGSQPFREAAKVTLLPAVATSHISTLPMSPLALLLSQQTPHFNEYNIKRRMNPMSCKVC